MVKRSNKKVKIQPIHGKILIVYILFTQAIVLVVAFVYYLRKYFRKPEETEKEDTSNKQHKDPKYSQTKKEKIQTQNNKNNTKK